MAYRITKTQLRQAIKTGQTSNQVCREIGCAKSTLYNHMRRLGLVWPNRRLKPGYRTGMLVVTQVLGSDGRNVLYACTCDCGAKRTYEKFRISGPRAFASCGCSHKRRGHNHPGFKGHGEIGSRYWTQVKAGAAGRGIHFSLSVEFGWNLFIAQNRRCALSGLPIKFGRLAEQTASLDRIRSKGSYTPGNVQWVHKDINQLKMHLDEPYFLQLCQLVCQHAATS